MWDAVESEEVVVEKSVSGIRTHSVALHSPHTAYRAPDLSHLRGLTEFESIGLCFFCKPHLGIDATPRKEVKLAERCETNSRIYSFFWQRASSLGKLVAKPCSLIRNRAIFAGP